MTAQVILDRVLKCADRRDQIRSLQVELAREKSEWSRLMRSQIRGLIERKAMLNNGKSKKETWIRNALWALVKEVGDA